MLAIHDFRSSRRIARFKFVRAVFFGIVRRMHCGVLILKACSRLLACTPYSRRVACPARALALSGPELRRVYKFETLLKPAIMAEARKRHADIFIKLKLHLDNTIRPTAGSAFYNFFQ